MIIIHATGSIAPGRFPSAQYASMSAMTPMMPNFFRIAPPPKTIMKSNMKPNMIRVTMSEDENHMKALSPTASSTIGWM